MAMEWLNFSRREENSSGKYETMARPIATSWNCAELKKAEVLRVLVEHHAKFIVCPPTPIIEAQERKALQYLVLDHGLDFCTVNSLVAHESVAIARQGHLTSVFELPPSVTVIVLDPSWPFLHTCPRIEAVSSVDEFIARVKNNCKQMALPPQTRVQCVREL